MSNVITQAIVPASAIVVFISWIAWEYRSNAFLKKANNIKEELLRKSNIDYWEESQRLKMLNLQLENELKTERARNEQLQKQLETIRGY